MERKAFQLLHDAENSWWYEGRANVVGRVLRRSVFSSQENICDIGAGWGGMIEVLKPYGKVSGIEPDEEARAHLLERGYEEILPLSTMKDGEAGRFSLVSAFDVLEHTDNDAKFLGDAHRMLTQDGKLVLTVPAYQWLWSEHDVMHHHYRRYALPELRRKIERAGFRVEFASYWNMTLFIPAAIVRLLGRSGEGSLAMPRILDRIFFAIVSLESFLIPALRLPFGTGIVLLAKKT